MTLFRHQKLATRWDGKIAYVFRHKKIGELGRLLILPHPSGQSQFVVEVSGSENDPMTQKRRELLDSVSKNRMGTMVSILGAGDGEEVPYSPLKQQQRIAVQEVSCEQCDKIVALLVLAPDASTASTLEDYARIVYDKVKEQDVPTWVIGTEEEIKVGNELVGKSLVLNMWPERLDTQTMLSTEINSQLDTLMAAHCK